MDTDRPISGEAVDTGVDSALSAPSISTTRPDPVADPAAARGFLDPASTTERLRLLWSTGARDVTLVAPGDGEGHRQPGAIDPRGWVA